LRQRVMVRLRKILAYVDWDRRACRLQSCFEHDELLL